MPLEPNSLEFGEFLLDRKNKELFHNGERLSINPKTYQLLVLLAENSTQLVEKDRLMQELWSDSFVEDANLAFTVSLLRKTLGDDARNPRFVETVPRRGYRFIAEVRAVESGIAKPNLVSLPAPVAQDASPESASHSFVPGQSHSSGAVVAIADWQREPSASDGHEKNGSTSTGAGKLEVVRRTRQQGPIGSRVVLAGLGLAFVLITAAIWYSGQTATAEEAPILLAALRSEKLSADGRVTSAAISPDGVYVAYTYEADRRQSVWLRDLRSSTNVQIIPPSENRYFDLAISPDSRTVYFARVPEPWPAELQPDIYRISTLGGVPDKIISEAQGSISLSADGTKISFRRCRFTDEDYCSLYIADSDGKNERLLLSRPRPIRIGDIAIAPDGKTVTFGTGQSRNGSDDFGLASVDVDTKIEREITPERFFDIWSISWLPNGQGLFLTARKSADQSFRIWKVSTSSGEAEVLTNDAESYLTSSLNGDASAMVCITNRPDYRLKIYSAEQRDGRPRVLADASTVSFAPDGTIIFASAMTGNHELSTINLDGSGQRQLTNDPAVDLDGLVSPKGNAIFFVSNRSGKLQVWRMNRDGTDQKQLTYRDGGTPLLLSPDGRWLYFVSARERKLTRIPVDGGDEEVVWDKTYDHHFALSPDASLVAISESRNGSTVLEIFSLEDKRGVRTFEVPHERTGIVQSAWSADGKTLYYVAPEEETGNFYIWRQDLSGTPRVRLIDIGPESPRHTRAFAVSLDGRRFAVVQGRWRHDAVLLTGLK